MRKPTATKILVAFAVVVTVGGMILLYQGRRVAQDTRPPVPISLNAPGSALPGTPSPRRRPATGSAEAVEQPADESAQSLALKVPRENIEEYLRLHNRSARSLLVAFYASGESDNMLSIALAFWRAFSAPGCVKSKGIIP
jgi:hypothetical protein